MNPNAKHRNKHTSTRRLLAPMLLTSLIAACGGGGGSSGGVANPPPPSVPPAPPPSPPAPPPPPATVTYLHKFRPDLTDGGQPNGPLLQASDGNFYGTTRAGGVNTCRPISPIPCGVIFKLTPTGEESVLYNFGTAPNDGYTPSGPLIQGQDGALYGVTSNGGEYGGGGVVFRITLAGNYSVLHAFGGFAEDGVVPVGGLIQATDGNFYGLTASGGAHHCFQIPQDGGNCGSVFKTTPTGETTILHSFGGFTGDGVTPLGSLVQASDGNFYGTTANGGANSCSSSGATNNCGALFRVTPAGVATILHSFGTSSLDGIAPLGTLLLGRDGALYGTTASGGGGGFCYFAYWCGTIFKMTLQGELTIVHAFATTTREDGYGPSQTLFQTADGTIYGATGSGGAHTSDLTGSVFKLTTAGEKTTLYSFGPLNEAPSNPVGGVIMGTDGALYGVTAYSGGVNGAGMVFKLVLR